VNGAIFNSFIQIAGVQDEAEANLLQQCGVKYLGFPLRLPVHRADVTEEEAASIIRRLHPPSSGVLITYLAEAREIVSFCRALGVRIVQLHGEISYDELRKIKILNPELTIIKSLVVGLHPLDTLETMAQLLTAVVDAFITDTFDPVTGASGATGKIHDWSVSQRLVELSERPVILAGGLTPDNVRKAIQEVRPAGVDAHTGVEDATGQKSREKVEKFMEEATLGFQALKEK
jgi:phosphoribosylanthranilate isomerase